ncbi:MAG TPA: nucleoside hydrolase [Pseudomonadales bacterium]
MAIPVVLDTDIGLDVDDVWALAFLLRCPELDVKLVTTATGDTAYRARVAARLLEVAGRTDIPIGIGIPLDDSPRTHAHWLGDYALDDYPGRILGDGVGAMCDVINASAERTTLIGIGPLPNVAAALARSPGIAERARFVGMHGSLRRGYLGAPKPMREYNVKQHALSCQAVFGAPWEKVITPLDSCGTVVLDGARFAAVRQSRLPLAEAVIANHTGWCEAVRDWPLAAQLRPAERSSVLFDTVAVYLAFSEELLEMEELPILVTSDGKTLIDQAGERVRCATGWKDEASFLDLLTHRLLER